MMEFNDIYNCTWINNNYYLLKKNNTFEVYDNDHKYIEKIKTTTKYSSISYNSNEKCYYLSLQDNNSILHKTYDFKTFNSFKLNLPIKCSEQINHIFYCRCLNRLLITTNTNIFLFDFVNKRSKCLFQIEQAQKFNDCIRPLGWNASTKMRIIATICCYKKIYVTYEYKNKFFIAELKNGKLGEIVYETDDHIKTTFVKKNELWILVDNGCYYEFINTKIKCGCDCIEKCGCQIVESIAAIEKSIAKILDSESLKIKAAIDKSDDISDLVCVNSSVKEVIYYVTVLEFILGEKLKTVKNSGKAGC